MPADSKVEHHLPPTASCPMDNGSWADEQGSGLTSPWPQKLAVHAQTGGEFSQNSLWGAGERDIVPVGARKLWQSVCCEC